MTIKQRLRARAATLVALLVAAVILPTAASAYEVTQSSTRPNGFAGQETYGGIPTRLTWKLKIEESDPGVQGVELKLPEGTDLDKSVVEVAILQGVTKFPVTPTVALDGSTVSVVLNQSVDSSEAISYLRVEVEDLVLPAEGGAFDITGSIVTSAGPVPVSPAKEQIEFKTMTRAESMIAWLDQQAWVQAWNSVKFLRMFFNPQLIVASIFIQFKGWLLAIALVAIGFPLAIPAGLLLAFAKMSKLAPIRWISSAYINII